MVGRDSLLEVRLADSRVEAAARAWLVETEPTGKHNAVVARGSAGRMVVELARDAHLRRPHGYRLNIRPGGVELVGGSPEGCYHGLQTLRQLSRLASGALPCCVIVDWPDFETRGLLHDVTRGKVPTLTTLKMLADRLASLKINQLQLNIEHAFVFAFDPDICAPKDGLTADDVRALDGYCRDRFIDLVPALATFGHMGRILSMPRYRHLAEVETDVSWADMDWTQRLRGLTLDCANPEAHRLTERMWSDVLDAFSAPVVNICGDEPHDLGQGKNKNRFAAAGNGGPYIEQIRRTHAYCAARGRSVQAWSDVVRAYPDRFGTLPDDLTVLHWGYDDADYDGSAAFDASGLATCVCPGTFGWHRIINAVNAAERNITTFAAAGKKHGARGLINTDWGDDGHFNLLGCSWHGIALGAAAAWRGDHPAGDDFDHRFARLFMGSDDATGIYHLRRASALAGTCRTWRMMWNTLADNRADPQLPTVAAAEEARHHAAELLRWCDEHGSPEGSHADDLRDIAAAARFTRLFTDKVALARAAQVGGKQQRRTDPVDWAAEVRDAFQTYAVAWRARNKPSGLADIERAVSSATDDVVASRTITVR